MASSKIQNSNYVLYKQSTGDTNTFKDGITIVSNQTDLNLPFNSQRCVVFTATLLSIPLRKVQFGMTMSHIYLRLYDEDGWSSWNQLDG